MGIAGEVGKRSQFAEDRHADVGAQSGFELREGGDVTALEEPLQPGRMEEERAHNVMILPKSGKVGRFITLLFGFVKESDRESKPCIYGLFEDSAHSYRAS